MENLEFALQVLFLGFFTVLLTLFALYGVISLFNRLFYRDKYPGSGEVALKPPSEAVKDQLTPVSPVIAAITAAVYAYLGEQKSLQITVQRSRTPAGNWAASGRKRQMASRSKLEASRRKKLREKI